MKNVLAQTERVTKETTIQVLDKTDQVSSYVNKKFNSYVEPVRTSVLKRFPVLFSLLVVFGLSTTYNAFEKNVTQSVFLNEHPFFMLLLGILVLAFTGRLYKKLA